ncbi:MAG: hypothetical protein JWR69_4238, partial [Pedosphaera sp.]|nr:hypothetical protein [Pedosphaera sp.]
MRKRGKTPPFSCPPSLRQVRYRVTHAPQPAAPIAATRFQYFNPLVMVFTAAF